MAGLLNSRLKIISEMYTHIQPTLKIIIYPLIPEGKEGHTCLKKPAAFKSWAKLIQNVIPMLKIKNRNSKVSCSVVIIAKFEQILQLVLQFLLVTLTCKF